MITIMKNYNELFELAKDLHSEAKSDKDVKSLELIERLFPQLKETEDEKTLADLKKLVYARADSRDLERFTNFLNRSTPVFTDKEESFCEHILPRIVNNPFEWSPEQRSADLEYLKVFIDNIKGRFSLKKDDANISMKETISNDKVLNTMLEHFKAKTKREWCGLNVSEIIDWLEKQKKSKLYWNPTEEDVALFNKAITTNTTLSGQDRAKLDIIRMKFKHHPYIEQKEQRPAEWSDGERVLLEEIIADIKGLNEYETEEELKQRYGEEIDFLKSLRPNHWKPSEEQMEALWNLMHYAVNLCSWPELEKSIESLYKGLKKL